MEATLKSTDSPKPTDSLESTDSPKSVKFAVAELTVAVETPAKVPPPHETATHSFYRPNTGRTARSLYVARPSFAGFALNKRTEHLPEGSPVLLNVYELNPCCVCCVGCPCAPGLLCGKLTCMGLFHCGLEFPGEREYTYNGKFGLFLNRKPREAVHTYHSPMRYAYSMVIGEHTATEEDLMPLIIELHEKGYQLGNYNFIKRNCNHFCEDLCKLLGLPPPPRFLNRFARFGARFLYCKRGLVGSWEDREDERKHDEQEKQAGEHVVDEGDADKKKDKNSNINNKKNVLKDSRHLTKEELSSIGWDEGDYEE